MKKLILSTALIAISLQAKLYAQVDDVSDYSTRMKRSKTEQTFNVDGWFINLRDFVVLREGRLILEMHGADDFESFRNLDSILLSFRKDIAFYKDSLDANPTGSSRIDYVLNPEYSFKKIRIKRYNADGSIFMNRDGEISRLKFDQDTIRIIIQKSRPGSNSSKTAPCMIPYSIQATFILGNYYDIDKVIADKVLKGIIDTLEKSSKTQGTIKRPSNNPLSIIYNPYYSGPRSFQKYNRLLMSEHDELARSPKSHFFSVNGNIGAGFVRGALSPVWEAGIQYNQYWSGSFEHNFYRLSVSPYYLFDRDVNRNLIVNDNWFVNVDMGTIYTNNQRGWAGRAATFGVGYLVAQKGGYFRNTTFKVFTDIILMKGFTIVPEFVFTNDCKQIFPGVTVKVF